MIDKLNSLITPEIEETIVILAVSLISYLITSNLIVFLISKIFKKTSTGLDDVLVEQGLLRRLSYLVPLLILYNYNISQSELSYFWIIDRLLLGSITIVFLLSVNAFLNSISSIYSQSRYSNRLNQVFMSKLYD